MHDRPLTITGTGDETRDFIFVDDLVEGLMRCADTEEAHGQAINLGTGRQTRIKDLADTIIRLTGSSSEIQYAPRRSWDNSRTRQADISRAKRILGLEPETRIETGLEETIEWFRQEYESIAESTDF